MASRHYDVVVLGRSVGALLSAALLARREFRVLVLGQGERPPSYRFEDYLFHRRSFSLLGATSPVFRRVLQELAQSQRFRRLTTPLDPMFAVLDGPGRFEIPPDVELFSREIEREYPEVATQVAELYALVSEVNATVDRAFERELVWPPGTFLERIETGRFAGTLPLVGAGTNESLLFERFPEGHAFRNIVQLPSLFSAHLGLTPGDLGPLPLTRLHGSWTRGIHHLSRGEQELEDFLVERIEAHGGTCRLRSKATSLVFERGRLVGIREDGESTQTGADALVTSMTGEALADLSGGEGVTKKAKESWPQLSVVGGRFVVSLTVDALGVPSALPQESFLAAPETFLPTVHLQISDTKPSAPTNEGNPGRALKLLTAEILLPIVGGLHVLGAREAVLRTLTHYLPFLEEHYVAIDSPHDGLPAWLFERNASGTLVRREMDRIHLRETAPQGEAMPPRFAFDRPGYLGLGGEFLRGPIPGTFLVGPSVLPALGQEGEMLAATSVAKILTRQDHARQKLRKKLWTKIETS